MFPCSFGAKRGRTRNFGRTKNETRAKKWKSGEGKGGEWKFLSFLPHQPPPPPPPFFARLLTLFSRSLLRNRTERLLRKLEFLFWPREKWNWPHFSRVFSLLRNRKETLATQAWTWNISPPNLAGIHKTRAVSHDPYFLKGGNPKSLHSCGIYRHATTILHSTVACCFC